MSTYNANIPQPTDEISQSQADLLGNFMQLNTYVAVDHVALNATNQGMHNQSSYVTQASAPIFGTDALGNILGIYNIINSVTLVNELYVHKTSEATTAEIPFTASILSNVSAPLTDSGGWSYLPSGIVLKFGSATGLTTGSNTITYPTTKIPAFTQTLTVIICAYGTNTGSLCPTLTAVSPTGFTVNMPAGLAAIQYLAIGY